MLVESRSRELVGRFVASLGVLVALMLSFIVLVPHQALASTYSLDGKEFTGDIAVGAFFTSDADMTDTIYASLQGTGFTKIATAYQQTKSDGEYATNHFCMSDPSIIYKDGYYWMIAGWNKTDGKIWFTISYSKDLVNWSHPEGESCAVDSTPQGKNGTAFDSVAPEFFAADDGSVYIVVSCGYYGAFHGEATVDTMQPYIAKVNTLSASGAGTSGHFFPQNLNVSIDTAHRLSFSNVSNPNWIDGSIYEENGTYYLYVKRDGLYNNIYTTTDVNNAGSWTYRANATSGYEGPSVIKINGSYHMYADHVNGATADGVAQFEASSPIQYNWPRGAFDLGGMPARHGTVITVKHGTDGWEAAAARLKAEGVLQGSEAISSNSSMYRLYNPNSGEHFFTANSIERITLKALGWKYEGLAWTAPATGDPVYRLYNANGGEHHYTTSSSEKDSLEKAGWKFEGVGWYSDTAKTTPLYRLYNPNAFANNHHYTTDASERDWLKGLGWRYEGIGWYGL